MIIDFHTHTFPDAIAPAAIAKLQSASHTHPFTDGTLSQLRAAMAAAGIDASLVLPVATHPRQVPHVNDASIALNKEGSRTGIYSFGCMHPDFPDPLPELARLRQSGIRGIKLHPIYQGADFDDPRYLRILDACGQLGLAVLIHAGLDVGFPGVVHASPAMIRHALQSVGPVTLILAHMGGWRCWNEAAEQLTGLGLYIDTSFSLGSMTPNGDGYYASESELRLMDGAAFLRVLRAFGADHTLFGTDCPWDDPAAALSRIRALPLTEKEQRAILFENAARLLGIRLS